MRRFFTYIIALLLCLIDASAQRSHWYPADLLTNNQIHCIEEDHNGFIWIGTEYGLNKFDGYQFSTYFHIESESNTLISNYVRCMKASGDGRIWVGTGLGLQLLDPDCGEFVTIPMPMGKTPFINQICIMTNGEVWFVASGIGVCRVLDYGNGKYGSESVDYISRLAGTSNHTYLLEDSQGVIWVGTNNGVYKCSPSDQSVARFAPDMIGSNITGIQEDMDGSVFVSNNTQVFKWDRDLDSLTEVPRGRSYGDITHLFKDRNGQLYVATRGEGLRHYDKVRKRLTFDDESISGLGLRRMDISAFHMDSKMNIWAGCFLNGVMLIKNGQTRFKSWLFQNYRDFPGGSITTMLVDNSGNLWTGFLDNPVTCFDSSGKITVQLHDQPYASCLYLSKDGTIWAGLYNGDLAILDDKAGTFDIICHNENNSPILSIAEDDSGNLYYSTRGSGFGRYDIMTGVTEHWSYTLGNEDNEGLDNDWVNTLAVDSEGMLWIGHNSGINCFDTESGKFVQVPSDINISGSTCNIILCDKSDNVWIGTSDGICVYGNGGICRNISTEDGLSNNSISGLLQDNGGNIWCSTRLGLNRIDTETFKIDRFYSGYGLFDKSYNTRACAFYESGNLLFWGSRQGITFFNPSEITGKDKVGKVVLTGLYLNDTQATPETLSGRKLVMREPVSVSDEFCLSYKDNSFTLEFSTFDYGNEECITYEYSFNHDQWNTTPAGVNRITFTRLSPGKHLLSVRAVSNNNLSETSSYTIRIASPWYLSAWAILAYAICASGVIMILAYNNKQHHIRELSEAKLHSFTNIAHELRSPLTMIISPLDELLRDEHISEGSRHSLRMMSKASKRILNLVNQLLDIRKYDEGQMHLKCRKTDMISFTQGIFEMFIYSAGQHNIKYSFHHNSDELLVWVDRDSIEKVINNLLSNAFKYTPDGGEIRIEVRSGTDDSDNGPLHHFMEISVIDSGIGLDVDDVNDVFERFYRADNTMTSVALGLGIGLNYSRILVEMHHGMIKARNREDTRGSVFWFRLPLGNSHLRNDEMEPDSTESFVYNKGIEIETDEPLKLRMSAARGYKVLVVDDDESLLDYINQCLRASYYKVITCKNGKEGLHLALSQMPDVIVSDVVMPEMDGISFVKALRNNPNISHIPVLLLSARNELQDRINGIETGADAYLPKPFYVNELKTQVLNLINNRLIMRGKYSGEQEQKDKIETPEIQSNDELLMTRVMDVVNKNMSNSEFSVELLADMVGVSRTQLHRKLKNITGLPAGRFINNIRLKQAARLLEQNSLNISEISDMVGFNTSAHFATAFKSYYGMTPSEYIKRKTAGKDSGEPQDA